MRLSSSAGLALALLVAPRSSGLGFSTEEYIELYDGAEDAGMLVNYAPAGADSVVQLREQERSRTLMQCLGTETMTRACHFENLYFDLNTSRFIHYGIAGAEPGIFGEDSRSGDPWLRLVRGMIQWRQGNPEAKSQFYMDWRAGAVLPAEEEVVEYGQPLHLRAPFNTKSIGHLLRDNLQFLIDLPLRFGRDPTAFDWVRWQTELSFSDWEDESSTAEHYRGLLNGRPSLTWRQVLDAALEGSDRDSVRFIRFAELIAGQGPADVFSQVGPVWEEPTAPQLSMWAHMCDPFPFTAMREVAYRNHGLQVASVHELEPFVLFLDGQPKEKRHLVNAGDLIPTLMQSFPGVRMEHIEISANPLETQLQLLSKATVLVTNIGSRSFRLIYLPNGATTILVGPPEYEVQLLPAPDEPADTFRVPVTEITPYTIHRPFIEIDWCWGYIGYVNILRYRIESAAEVPQGETWSAEIDVRNSDVVLDEHKITALLRVALERAQHSTAQRGGGILSACAS